MTTTEAGNDALIVFAKWPVPGRVKTRLAAEIGAEVACGVYRDLVGLTLEVGQALEVDRYLYMAPEDAAVEAGWLSDAFAVRIQAGEGLGDRMERAFQEAFGEGHRRVVLVGSDCPYLTPDLLKQAFSILTRTETVFGPAADGGYYLVGQAAPPRDLFSGIRWSTGEVMRSTEKILQERNWSYRLLPVLEDVDDLPSLERYRRYRRERDGRARKAVQDLPS